MKNRRSESHVSLLPCWLRESNSSMPSLFQITSIKTNICWDTTLLMTVGRVSLEIWQPRCNLLIQIKAWGIVWLFRHGTVCSVWGSGSLARFRQLQLYQGRCTGLGFIYGNSRGSAYFAALEHFWIHHQNRSIRCHRNVHCPITCVLYVANQCDASKY